MYEVPDVLRGNHHQIGHLTANSWQSRTLYALEACRTYRMGGHIDKCTNVDCNHIHISYNSCRNRHYPKWISAKGKDKYLFPVKSMSKVFRARFIEALRKEIEIEQNLSKKLFAKNWVVYCKQAFLGSKQVIEYLGRYTHKIAISNHRILSIDNGSVTFTAKDYRHGGKKHPVSLKEAEFIRRFSMHILPKGFTRIRHYGILSSSLKKFILPIIENQIGKIVSTEKSPGINGICPVCKSGMLVTIIHFDSRGPPNNIQALIPAICKSKF